MKLNTDKAGSPSSGGVTSEGSRTSGVQRDGEFVITSENGQSVHASLIHLFEASDDLQHTAAPGIRSMVAAIFSSVRGASRVAYVVTRGGTPLLLVEASHQWFDATAEPVKLRKEG